MYPCFRVPKWKLGWCIKLAAYPLGIYCIHLTHEESTRTLKNCFCTCYIMLCIFYAQQKLLVFKNLHQMYPCSMERDEVVKLRIVQQNHLAFNDQISKAITKFGPSAGLGGSQVFLHFETLVSMVCSKSAAADIGSPQHIGCVGTARHGVCRETCHDAAGTGGGFPCPAGAQQPCQGKLTFLQGVERASLPFSIECNYFSFTESSSLNFSLIFPLCSHDNLTQSKHKICF